MRKVTTRLSVLVLAVVSLVTFGSPPAGSQASRGGEIIPAAEPIAGEYIVTLQPDEPVRATSADLAAEYDGAVLDVFRHALRGFSVAMSEADALALSEDPAVAAVEENGVISIDTTQNSPPWGLDRIDQRDLPLSGTYTYDETGDGVTAYIIDTGIRITHVDFSGRASIGTDTIGDGQNGNDCNGHGTHVAGTVGGETHGVAKDVNLVAVRVLNCGGNGSVAGVIQGIDWVTANAVDPAVANMSLGGGLSAAVNDAVTNSVSSGVTYVVAAGNEAVDACTRSPASTPLAITVGATDAADNRAGFSNFGPCLDIFAPGVSILSAWFTSDSATNTSNGTSMASPHVAGAAATVLDADPTATPAEVTTAILDASTPNKVVGPGTGSPNQLLFSVIDVIDPAVTITSPADGTSVVRGSTLTADFACTDAGGSGLSGCVGDVADGATVDTSTVGSHQFTVTGTDDAGNQTVVVHDYTVTAPVCAGQAVTVMLSLGDTPTAGNDVILGTAAANTVNGGGGRDTICGLGGPDTLSGGAAADKVFGGNGNDVANGGGGVDTLEGGNNNDRLNGGPQRDTCRGQAGTDSATGCEVRSGIP